MICTDEHFLMCISYPCTILLPFFRALFKYVFIFTAMSVCLFSLKDEIRGNIFYLPPEPTDVFSLRVFCFLCFFLMFVVLTLAGSKDKLQSYSQLVVLEKLKSLFGWREGTKWGRGWVD